MEYTLDRLGSDNFETLVQSLCLKILGSGVKIYGAGPDGQREASFTGKSDFPSVASGWSGYFVAQAKYKAAGTRAEDFPWLKKQFESEMAGFAKKKKQGKKIPDNYLFFTNIALTPVAETGIKDKADAMADQYRSLIPNIAILGKDEICRYLELYREVALSYTAFIMPSDILAHLYENVTRAEKEKFDALLRYTARCFKDDYCSRMDQAGKLTDEQVPIDKIYVDLRMSEARGDRRAVSFIKTALAAGEKRWDFRKRYPVGEYNNLLEIPVSAKPNRFVIRGGAGGGKSTVCQFLAQIYRARFLTEYQENYDEKIELFSERVKSDGIALPHCARIPVRIELRLYSAYIADRKKAGKNYDLVTFIAGEIARKSASDFDNDTLRRYMGAFSFSFFFDGLDEVSENSNRKDVMEQIENFIDLELRQRNTDCTFFATTRPEGYVGEFGSDFRHYDLLPLAESECVAYLNKLLSALETDTDKRDEYMKILTDALKHEQIAFMMQTPLQATIMAVLVRSGGEPPRDKYSLFKEYFGIILKREKQKSVQTILNDNQQLIENIYYMLGYELQKLSYVSGKSDALISYDELKKFIDDKLELDGLERGGAEFSRISDEAFRTVVHRVNFAAEIRDGRIGFPIRSMQEFLAAVYIKINYRDDELTPLLIGLARNAYWKNTFMFLVECIDKEKQYFTDIILDTVLSELNGNSLPLGRSDALSGVMYGSRLAYEILVNNIFKNKPRCENKLCRHFGQICLMSAAVDYTKISDASDYVKSELCKYISAETDDNTLDARLRFAAVLCESGEYYEKLGPFVKSHAAEVLRWYAVLYGTYIGCQPEIIVDGLNSSETVLGDMIDLTYLIDYLPQCNENARKVVFEATVRSAIDSFERSRSSLEKLGAYFGCDFLRLKEIYREYDDDLYEMNSDLDIVVERYRLPSRKTDFKSVISVAEKFGSEAVSTALKVANSYEIKDYIGFLDNAERSSDDIKRLGIDIFLKNNPVCEFILDAVENGEVSNARKELNAALEERLKKHSAPYDLTESFEEARQAVPLYRVNVSIGKDGYRVYDAFLAAYGEEKILSEKRLLEFALYDLACIAEHRNDMSAKYRKKCDRYLPQALGFVKAYGKSKWWCDEILMRAVTDLPESEYNYISERFRFLPSDSFMRHTGIKSKTDAEKYFAMRDKLVRFIELTGNKAACGYLLKIVLCAPRLIDLRALEWKRLRPAGDERFTAAELLFDESNDHTERIKELFSCADAVGFIRSVFHSLSVEELSSLRCDGLDIYVHMLGYYRVRGDKTATVECERKINEMLAATKLKEGLLK